MMYAGCFFVDIADILSVNCGLYPFWNVISVFEILTLSPILNFGLVYFMNDLFNKIDKKSRFFPSLGNFQLINFCESSM